MRIVFSLELCKPYQGNQEIAVTTTSTKEEAIAIFRQQWPMLDDTGYYKCPKTKNSYITAEQFDGQQSNYKK